MPRSDMSPREDAFIAVVITVVLIVHVARHG
jgi:hypothetical protein